MASSILHRGDDTFVGHASDEHYLLYVGGFPEAPFVKLGRDVEAADDGHGGFVLSSPHTPCEITVPAEAKFNLPDGQRIPQVPIIRRLLAAPAGPQPLFAE